MSTSRAEHWRTEPGINRLHSSSVCFFLHHYTFLPISEWSFSRVKSYTMERVRDVFKNTSLKNHPNLLKMSKLCIQLAKVIVYKVLNLKGTLNYNDYYIDRQKNTCLKLACTIWWGLSGITKGAVFLLGYQTVIKQAFVCKTKKSEFKDVTNGYLKGKEFWSMKKGPNHMSNLITTYRVQIYLASLAWHIHYAWKTLFQQPWWLISALGNKQKNLILGMLLILKR